ncbi:MAG: acetyl-CoA carboxylase biotin carboxylase subunit [bacterium]|nr:acetyl-CoA carboxylase biotin carboxylase subunit [bacterium]
MSDFQIKKILIANRGEIALRVIRAAKELGIKTVAVYSVADKDSLHVRFADEAICIGPPPSAESYLNSTRILAAAEISGADAIHPGYGFLSENADFAEQVIASGIIWIGPNHHAIRQMGDKALAKATMKEAGVPVIPGSNGIVKEVYTALQIANEIGYPVILKATAGGGGRGMRIVRNAESMESIFGIASAEAESAFGCADLYLEKYIEQPRHIEVQVIGDKYGNIIHLGERECTIQRRHQKLIEETPSPVITPERREIIGNAAVLGAKKVNYDSAGTMEFIYDPEGKFYFLEMNTRIQVEHPITEQVTRIDLVKEQIRVAAGEKLSKTQDQVHMRGHCFECRINAEDPDRNFLPSPIPITALHFPGGPGVRIDSCAYDGYVIPPYYDSLLGKLIVFGIDRHEAIMRMRRALEEMIVEGPKTTIPLHIKIFNDPVFVSGKFDTTYLETVSFLKNK